MKRNPFFPEFSADRQIPTHVVLILGSLLTGIALVLFAHLFL